MARADLGGKFQVVQLVRQHKKAPLRKPTEFKNWPELMGSVPIMRAEVKGPSGESPLWGRVYAGAGRVFECGRTPWRKRVTWSQA